MKVSVNGEAHDVEDGTSVDDLLRGLGVAPDFVAVAQNGQVVPQGERDGVILADGDSLDVVRAAPGG